MSKRCPYCNSIIDESLQVCSNCNNDLSVECPYCKNTVKAYDTVCPHCSSVLRAKDESKLFIVIATIINCLWVLVNILIDFLMISFPQIFTLPDDKSVELVVRLGQVCVTSFAVVAIPYIIAIIKKFKIKWAIACLIINFLLTLVFIFIIALLYYIYA